MAEQLAEIKRLEGRLATLEANAKRGTVEHHFTTSAGPLRIVEDPDAARVQLIFDGKPSNDVRDMLKRHGFQWAPSVSAWQRHLNNAGRSASHGVLRALEAKRDAAPAPEAPEPTESPIGHHMGRTLPTARRFDTDDEANAFMASPEGAGFGVLYVAPDNAVIVAQCDDLGQRAA
ncbi:hypothetical protein BK022_16150 [Methylorubrum extorquens]|uniref:Uncharacterized protein n=1 Tax=Methylorubrum extorquens TaxID=408 RepID=A0A1S1P3H1_METEX|nr:hypothetical protein BK022_16150 [Methylorubrum extorquens]